MYQRIPETSCGGGNLLAGPDNGHLAFPFVVAQVHATLAQAKQRPVQAIPRYAGGEVAEFAAGEPEHPVERMVRCEEDHALNDVQKGSLAIEKLRANERFRIGGKPVAL